MLSSDAPVGARPRASFISLLILIVSVGGCDFSTTVNNAPAEEDGPHVARRVRDVTWNADFTRVDVTYEAEGCEGGEGDTCDIDAVTLICEPGRDGTVRSCDVSN